MAPQVSVIIPTRNRRELLIEALESVRAQTFGDWEAIVVDDGSTDGTAEAVSRIAREDARVRYVELSPARRGGSVARNQGVRQAGGRYLVFLDSDDALAPDCLRRRVEVMRQDPELDFAVFPCQVFRERPGDTPLLWNADTGEDDLDRLLKGDIPWQTTSPIWRRGALEKVGPWDEDAPSAQDWEFHIRALVAGLRYARLEPPDCYWRRASAERDSIGKAAAMDVSHLHGKVAVAEKLQRLLESKALLTGSRRRMMAGIYFRAAEQMAQRASRREARAIWRRGRTQGLLSPMQYAQGVAYLFACRWRLAGSAMRRRLQRCWPAELLGERSPTLVNTPLQERLARGAFIPSPAPAGAGVREARPIMAEVRS